MFKEQYGSLLNIKEIDKNNISIINNEIWWQNNLYNLEIFNKLNQFTNKYTFYSNIWFFNKKNYYFYISKLWSEIYDNLNITKFLKEIEEKFFYSNDDINRILWLDYIDNKIIFRLRYNFQNNLSWLYNKNIFEEFINKRFGYFDYDVEINKNIIDINIELPFDKNKINKNIFTNLY
jgi:hypothetical protein